jgi:hypothetical protein
MSVFVDDVVVRLYGTIGDTIDHTDILESVSHRLESFDIKCHDLGAKIEGLGRLPARLERVDVKISMFDAVSEKICCAKEKIDRIESLEHQTCQIGDTVVDLNERFDRIRILEAKIDEVSMLFSRTGDVEIKLDAMRHLVDSMGGLGARTGLEEEVKNKLIRGDQIEAKLDEMRAYLSKLVGLESRAHKMDHKLEQIACVEIALET